MKMRFCCPAALIAAVVVAGPAWAGDAADAPISKAQPTVPPSLDLEQASVEELEKQYEGQTPPEGVRMFLAIMKGSQMGIGEGWFTTAQTPYTWSWLAQRSGVDPKDAISAEQFPGSTDLFNKLDRDKNGRISADDLDWSDSNPWVRYAYLCNRMFRKIDPTGDGRLTREEWIGFFDKVAGDRDAVSSDDLRDAWLAGMTASFLPGDAPTKERLLDGLVAGDLGSMQEGPIAGDAAPDFTLSTADGRQTLHLSEATGKKPVVLCFGNFTCGPFRSMYPDVERVRDRYRDLADFYFVYVREAHPTDGWVMQSNDRVGVRVSQPKTYGERCSVAEQCQSMLKPTINWYVDDSHDTVGHLYSGMPARLYVINTDGKVTYKGGRGPFGFKVGEMEQALAMTLLDQAGGKSGTEQASKATAPPALVAHTQSRVELPSSEDAWKKLPEASIGPGSELPNWARALADALPHTAAAMLDLDYTYRTTTNFTQRERGIVRRAVAGINRSAYGVAYADFDLRAAGWGDEQLSRLDAGDLSDLDEREQRLYRYAQQASKAARDLTDSQVEQLKTDLGEERLVALVLLTAYANFQDRMIHALALPLETGGPLPPLEVKFSSTTSTTGGSLVPQAERDAIPSGNEDLAYDHPEWSDFAFVTLQERLEKQRDRSPRVSIPTWEDINTKVPKGLYSRTKPLEIRWSRLVIGSQPQMGMAWIRCLRVFGNEAKQDRAFEESVFWVVTRDLRCFYCMGHCEMLMEVGGLNPEQIADRTHRMAEGDWKDFTPAERATFALASEMTRTPWTVSDQDVAMLRTALGPERALDAIWWISRCQFMTKVSDTFQLQLERTNVFQDFEPPKETTPEPAAPAK